MGDVYDTIVFPDARYEFPAGRQRLHDALCDWFPTEHRAIGTYFELIRECVKASRSYFVEKVLPRGIAKFAGPLLARKARKFANRTTLEVLSKFTDNRRLIAVLTGQYGDYGLPPAQSSFFMHALVVNHYFAGGAYPVGGSSQIAASIVPLIEERGGRVATSVSVDSIVIENGRAVGVKLEDGSVHRASAIVSNAGVARTIESLLPADARARHNLADSLAKVKPSVAHASLYLGFQKTAVELGLEKSNLWVYPTDDHDANVSRFAADPNAPLPVAYLSFPSAKDPDFERRYQGRATVEIVTLAPFERFEAWKDTRWGKRGEAYDEMKVALTEKMLAALYREHPNLEAELDHCELSTPLSTRHFANFASGEIYGVQHDPARFSQRWMVPKTPIENLYLTGADICTAGVGGALMGGVLTTSAMLGRNMIKPILTRRPTRRAAGASRAELGSENEATRAAASTTAR